MAFRDRVLGGLSRHWMGWAAACAIVAWAQTSVRAQDASSFYAGKTIKMLVGMPPGGGVDAYARLLQRHIVRFLPGSPQIVVQNVPGAGSLRAVMSLVTSPDDGTSIVTFSSALLTEAILAPARVKVDFRSFAFLGNIGEDVRICYLRAGRGIRTWAQLVASDGVIFGSTTAGTSGSTDVAMLRSIFGVKLRKVQGYAGAADKRLALEKGEIDGDCAGWTSLPEDWVAQHKVDVMLRLSPTLLPRMSKDVPYGGDLVSGSDRQVFDLLTAPIRMGRLFMVSGNVAPDRVAVLRAAFDKAMADAEFNAEAGKLGLMVSPTSGVEVARRVAALYETPQPLLVRARTIAGE